MSYTNLFYHIVFSTKNRRPFLSDDVLLRACQYMGGITRKLKSQLLLANGVSDHVHLATMVHPTIAIAEFIGKVKSNSSGWIHDTFADLRDFDWQDGYAGFTVSPSVMPKVKQYIRSQPEHHKKVSFQEELIALLKKHGVEYDEKYICA
ncbi:MAG: IS200/IS605 family transposase [Planctomycetota bacterium]|nr:IS200/IS605 family transposase [Planctomycetota bacterium]